MTSQEKASALRAIVEAGTPCWCELNRAARALDKGNDAEAAGLLRRERERHEMYELELKQALLAIEEEP